MFKMINRGITRYSEANEKFMSVYKLFFPENKLSDVLERMKQLQLIKELTFYERLRSENDKVHVAATIKFSETDVFQSLYDQSTLQRHAPIGVTNTYLMYHDAEFVDKTYWATTAAPVSKESILLHELTHYLLSMDDHVYGAKDCMKLLMRDPSAALNNADSYAWFLTFLHETENGMDYICFSLLVIRVRGFFPAVKKGHFSWP